jgi:hypothetical protein
MLSAKHIGADTARVRNPKAKGTAFGHWTNAARQLAPDEQLTAQADALAESILSIIESPKNRRLSDPRRNRQQVGRRRLPQARGKSWHASSVRNVIAIKWSFRAFVCGTSQRTPCEQLPDSKSPITSSPESRLTINR